MQKFNVFDYAFKMGLFLVILAFAVGFFGNKYHSVSFALAYYHYLYILVITFGGIQYGMIGGFFTSTFICILHVVSLNANPQYYTYNAAPVNYNAQLIFFTLMGVLAGLGNEMTARQNMTLQKNVSELTKKLAASPAPTPGGATAAEQPAQRIDTSVKYYNFLLKFSKLIAAARTVDDALEALLKALAVDYGIKECALFMVTEKGRLLTGKMKKGLQHIEKIEETTVNFGEGIVGKAAVNLQVIINEASEKSNEWQIAVPLTVHGSTYGVIGAAKCRTVGLINSEDTQYIHKIAEITSAALDTLIPKDQPRAAAGVPPARKA